MIAFGRQIGTMYRVACFDVPFKAEKIFEKRLDKLLAGFEFLSISIPLMNEKETADDSS